MVLKFDAIDYETAVRNYEDEWSLLDSALYRICREHPDHSPASLHAKLWLVGRTYAAGIERHVSSKATEFEHRPGGSLLRVAELILAKRKELNKILSNLRDLSEPLDRSTLGTIVKLHGQFVKMLKEITRDGHSARTFVSKYMHFHNEVVPIYDNIAGYNIRRLGWVTRPLSRVVMATDDDDVEYCDYINRFYDLYRLIQSKNLPLKVKYLDKYLLSL